MNNLIIASANRELMRPWLEVLSPKYPLAFINNIEMFFSEERKYDENILLVLDAELIKESYQLSLLCKYFNKILVVGENFSPSQQIQFIYEGACGYSEKLIDMKLISRTVDGVLNDEIWLKREYLPQMIKGVEAKQFFSEKREQIDNKIFTKISILTQREIEVMEYVYSGKDNVFIAEQLQITNRTVKAHLSAVFRKLNVPDRFKLVVFLKDLQVGHLVSANNPL